MGFAVLMNVWSIIGLNAMELTQLTSKQADYATSAAVTSQLSPLLSAYNPTALAAHFGANYLTSSVRHLPSLQGYTASKEKVQDVGFCDIEKSKKGYAIFFKKINLNGAFDTKQFLLSEFQVSTLPDVYKQFIIKRAVVVQETATNDVALEPAIEQVHQQQDNDLDVSCCILF